MSALASLTETAQSTKLHLLERPGESRPSPRAIAWAWEVILHHGQPASDGLVRVALSQRQLAIADGCSPGTISWYLRSLGPAARRDAGAVVFDRRALSQLVEVAPSAVTARCEAVANQLRDAFGQPSSDGNRLDLVVQDHGRWRPASLTDMATELGLARSSIHRHLNALERSGLFGRRGRLHFIHQGSPSHTGPSGDLDDAGAELGSGPLPVVQHAQTPASVDQRALTLLGAITDLLGDVAQLVETIVGPARPGDERPARDVSAQSSSLRDLRASSVAPRPPGSSESDLKDEISSGQSTARESLAHEPNALRANDSRHLPDWIIDQLPELLAPLLDECRRLSLPGVTDASRVAESLSPFTAAQIAAAARHLAASLAGGAPMRSPVAVLVAKARAGDPYCFPPVRTAEAAPPPVVRLADTPDSRFYEAAPDQDEEAASAVASMSATELEELDALVRQRQPYTSRGRAVRGNDMWRRIIWRERRSAGAT